MMKKTIHIGILMILIMSSCQKTFLDKKPDKAILVPTRLNELQALLDNYQVLNRSTGIGYLSNDDFNTTDAGFSAFTSPIERNAYRWQTEITEGASLLDWNVPYQEIFYANVVLEGLANLSVANQEEQTAKNCKGHALFLRAYAYFQLMQLFSEPYQTANAGKALGVPIVTASRTDQSLVRNTQEEVFNFMEADLKSAVTLLNPVQNFATRPDQAAGYAMLARIALAKADYPQVVQYAKQALDLRNNLIDYNTLSAAASKPFPIPLPNQNTEVLYYTAQLSYSFLNSSLCFVSPELYQSYDNNDLRKGLYFLSRGSNQYTFKGSYSGSISPVSVFEGPTTNEVMLMYAEALVRTGKLPEGIGQLNKLLKTRWKTGTYTDFNTSDPLIALTKILTERRKELVGRGLRWFDLRRLNLDPRFQKSLSRTIAGQTYELAPQSKKYTFPIPDQEVKTYGWVQNVRE
jgi:hypothetical protein